MTNSKDTIKSLPWRRIAVISCAILSTFVGVVIAGLIYIDTDTGRTQLAAMLNDTLKTPESTVNISGFEGSLYSDLTVPTVTISDQTGIWLEAKNTKLSWSLMALLSKRLDIANLNIETVNVIRTPAPSDAKPEPTGEPFSLPSLPLDIKISNYAIDHLKIGEALTNIDSEFTIDGALFLTKLDGIDAKMSFVSTAGHQDAVNVDISYPGSNQNLDVKIDLVAPEDGLLLSLTDAKLQNDAFLTLSGTGPLDDWRGNMDARIGDQPILNAAIEHIDQITSINADFNINEFVPMGFEKLAGGPNNLNLKLSPAERLDTNDFDLTITSKFAQFNARGILSLDEPRENDAINFTLDITNTNTINEFITPSYVKPTIIRGIINNLNSDPSFMVNISTMNVGVKNTVEAVIDGEITGYLKNQIITVNSSGKVESIVGPAVDAFAGLLKPGIDWSIKADIDQSNSLAKINQMSVGNNFAAVSATAILNSETGELSADVKSGIVKIENIATALNFTQSIFGQTSAGIKISRSAIDTPLDVQITLSADELDLGDKTLNDLVGPTPTFNAHINQSASGALALSDTALDASVIKFAATANISPEQIINDANFKLSLVNIENITTLDGTALAGNIDVLGTLSGDLSDPSLLVETGFNQVNLQNFELSNFVAQLKVDNILGDLEGKIEIQSASNFGDLSTSSSFNKLNEEIKIPALSIALGAYELVGSFDIPSAKPVSGSVNLITHEVNETATGIDGKIDAEIKLSDDNNNQRVSLESSASDISLPLGENDILTLKAGQISANILLSDNATEIKANVVLTDFMHPRLQISDATLNIDQKDSGISYLASLAGSESMPFEFEIDGNFLQDADGGQEITVALNGSINEEEVKLHQPMQILLEQESVRVPRFTLQIGEGELIGNFEQNNDGRTAVLKITNTDLETVKSFVPELPFTALLNGDLNLQSTLETLKTEFNLSLSNIASEEQNLSSDDNIMMTVLGAINENNTDLSGILMLQDHFNSEFSLAIPIEIDPVSLETKVTDDTPLNGKVSWNGDITPFWPTLKLIDHDLKGDLTADLIIGGTLAVPDIDGNITVNNGRYENMQTGFIAGDIEMAATILDRQFMLDKFNANDGENGTISATANVDIDPDLSYSAKADLTLVNTHIMRQSELQITASSNLTFEKNDESSSLKGNIIVQNADVGAVSQSGPAIAKLDVTEINAEGIVANSTEPEDALGPIDLDLELLVPGKLFIRSFGLDSEWKADLKISGSSEEPIIDGTAELVRGFFEFSGKRFSLTRGSFSFPGDKTNDPIIEIAAEHQLSDMVANLRIYGLASNPSLEMSSTPYLPENEVLARILFGTSVAQLTAVEAVQLASAVHSLSNGGGQGLLGGIRRAIGVDRLSIDNDSSREYGTTITGGKYLTDNVYVEVSTAPATGETATSVEVGLTRNLSLVTRRTLDHDNNLSIRWFRDY